MSSSKGESNVTDDETYSLIFNSLKHPIRRKILRMLRDDELTFSQILEALSLDSGHLSYHLENLGHLITHSSDGKYKLSSFGMAAVRLMSGVEEHSTSKATRQKNSVNASYTIFSVILAIALLLVSIYSANLTTRVDQPYVDIPRIFALAPNQAFEVNLTFTYRDHEEVVFGSNSVVISTHEPMDTISEWVRYPLLIDFEFNTTNRINVTVREPSDHIVTMSYPQSLGGSKSVGVPLGAYLSQNGTYYIEIENAYSDWLYGNLTLHIRREIFERPLFYYGLAGVITASLYPTILSLAWLWSKKSTSWKP